MNRFDLAIETVRSFSVKRRDLSTDGNLVLQIAARLLHSEISETDGFSFVRAGNVIPAVGSNVAVFVSMSDPAKPAFSNSDYMAVSQDYAATLRTMCLRFWADKGVLPSVTNGSRPLWFPQAARAEVPWGAEFMWSDCDSSTEASKCGDATMPDWYITALNTLENNRLVHFQASYSYAILFTLLHELSHIKLGHYTNQRKMQRYQKELDADGSAIFAMFHSPILSNCMGEPARIMVLQMATGVIAAFVVFHLLLIKKFPATAGLERHQGYPTVSERSSHMLNLLTQRSRLAPNSWFGDLIAVMRVLLDVASLHPAFAYVIGTGWIRH